MANENRTFYNADIGEKHTSKMTTLMKTTRQRLRERGKTGDSATSGKHEDRENQSSLKWVIGQEGNLTISFVSTKTFS